jgi:protein-S-isoprenylcysteine O-methyltransferase Ste14
MDPGWPTTQLIPRSDALSILGLVLCALGIGFAIWARRTLGTNWSAIPTIKEGHELVMRGPYRLARHPIYTGILLALLGNNLAYGAVYNAILFVFCAAGIIWKLKIEERLMMQQFPEVYPEYKKQVKALVPFVF